MWNTFKFFFTWFWLGLVSFLVGLYFLGAAHPGAAHEVVRARHAGPPDPAAFLVFVVPFFMSVPAYFLARPKRSAGSFG